eukprot:scaffold136638_cov58-Attheya_sp.AAC.3
MVSYSKHPENAAVITLHKVTQKPIAVEFDIEGDPRPLARCRIREFFDKVRSTAKWGHSRRRSILYSPSQKLMEAFGEVARDVLMMGSAEGPPLFQEEDFLLVFIAFSFKRPKAHFTAHGILRDAAPKYPRGVGDIDNLAKLVLDALNGILYKDDSTIVQLVVRKDWIDEPAEFGCTYVEAKLKKTKRTRRTQH